MRLDTVHRNTPVCALFFTKTSTIKVQMKQNTKRFVSRAV